MIVVAAAALGIWAHAEVKGIKRRGFRKCVHDNDAEATLALCDRP